MIEQRFLTFITSSKLKSLISYLQIDTCNYSLQKAQEMTIVSQETEYTENSSAIFIKQILNNVINQFFRLKFKRIYKVK